MPAVVQGGVTMAGTWSWSRGYPARCGSNGTGPCAPHGWPRPVSPLACRRPAFLPS